MTLISFLLLLALLGVVSVALVRIVPIYVEHYMVLATLKSLREDRELANKTREEIFEMLQRRWEINNIDEVSTKNVKLERDDDGLRLKLRYDVSRHVFGNLDVAVHFDDVVDIDRKP